MPRIKCKSQELWIKIEEFNWRPIQPWKFGGPLNLEGLEARPTMMEANEGFSWAWPTCNILSVRIGLGKAHDHSLFVHSSCMFNVRMRYVCWSMLCMYKICIWMNVQCHAMYVCDIYIDTWIQCMYEIYILWMYVGMQCMYEICMLQNG